MPAKDGFVLTDLDMDYLRHVYRLRIATIDHLVALTGRSYTRTQKRTAKLEARRYLTKLTLPPRKILYGLGSEGVAALVEAGYAPEEILQKRIRTKELKDLFLRHLLMIKDIQVKLFVDTQRTSTLRIYEWSEGEQLYDSVTIQEKHDQKTLSVRIPVRPDAFFVLHDASRPDGRNLLPFVLEADCSHRESHNRMRTKVKGYLNYSDQQLPKAKWGYTFFRVLTVSQSAVRADNLRNDLHALLPSRLRPHYLFIDIGALTLGTLFRKLPAAPQPRLNLTYPTLQRIINRMEEKQRVAEGNSKHARKRIVITDRDIAILKSVHDYRLLRIEQLEALTSRTYTRVHRRVKGLFDAGFLKRREVPQKKDIYYVGRPALVLLLSHGLISEDEALRRSREHELRPDTLDHEMMISDVHLTLELATKPGPQTLITWIEGETIRDTFEVGGFAPQRVVISPDAFFKLKDTRLEAGKDSRIYFLEADRSTMLTQPRPESRRFRDKVERYRLFIERGRPFEKYGVQAVRIVTLTLTRERRDNLCADTEKFLAENNLAKLRKFFLFGTIKDISLAAPETILEPLFIRPGSTKIFPLFPSLAETVEGA